MKQVRIKIGSDSFTGTKRNSKEMDRDKGAVSNMVV
jgi:hypothetical protein